MKPSFEDQEELEQMRHDVAIVEAKEISMPEKVSMQFGKDEIFAKIAEYKPFVGMTIAGIADKATYTKVKAASTALMRLRTGTDARKKALKAETIAYNKTVDEAYNEIVGAISEIEDQLDKEIKRIDNLEKADQEAKQRIINERVSKRTQDLLAVRHDVTGISHLLAGMPEDQYQTIYAGAKTKFDAEEAERVRKEAELARLQAEEAERQRIAAEAKAKADQEERERLDAQRKAQAEAQAKLDAERAEIERERKAIEAAKAEQKAREEAQERKEREAKIAAEAAEKAKAEAAAQAKAEAEKKEREERERAEREEAERKAAKAKLAAIEAAKPDTEKLKAFLSSFDAVTRPELKTEAAEKVLKTFEADLADTIVRATINAEGLIK